MSIRKLGHNATIENIWTPSRKTSSAKAAEQLKVEVEIPDTIVFDENFVYAKVRAISSRVNLNADGFRRNELLGAIEDHEPHNEKFGYRTFIGKNVHVDHYNQPELAEVEPKHHPRGDILFASYHEDPMDKPVMLEGFPDPGAKVLEDPVSKLAGSDCWVELLMASDRRKFPVLCEAIEQGLVTKVSMGAEIINSSCSVCGNVARHEFEYCDHARFGRGQVYAAQNGSPFVKEGFMSPGDPVMAFEDNHGLQFFEESWILDVQADPTAILLDLIRAEPGMSLREVEAAKKQINKAANYLKKKIAIEEEKPKVNLNIDNVDKYLENQETDDSKEEEEEETTEEEVPEMDYTRPPHEQEGEFAPDYPFPCSARTSASEANPDYPIDATIDVEVCMGCLYNRSNKSGYVDCSFPEVVREGGKDPLPAGFSDPQSTQDQQGSGFKNDDNTNIEEFPGLEHPPRSGR